MATFRRSRHGVFSLTLRQTEADVLASVAREVLELLDVPERTVDPLQAQLTYAELTPAVIGAHPLIINTTPLGTYPAVHECPSLPYEALTPAHYLFDLIYNPRETLFLERGRLAGAHTKNGFEMLELQAEAAWDIWNAN